MVVDKFVVPQDHKLSAWYKRWIGPSDPRTIGLFFWTIFLDYFFWTIFGPFSLDLLLDHFWTIFLDHFIGGETDHWDAVYQYSGRGGGQAVVHTNY